MYLLSGFVFSSLYESSISILAPPILFVPEISSIFLSVYFYRTRLFYSCFYVPIAQKRPRARYLGQNIIYILYSGGCAQGSRFLLTNKQINTLLPSKTGPHNIDCFLRTIDKVVFTVLKLNVLNWTHQSYNDNTVSHLWTPLLPLNAKAHHPSSSLPLSPWPLLR